MNTNMNKYKDYLLFRREEGQRVWLYERLAEKELLTRIKEGWKIWI